jgi:hypothetical protein
VIQPPYDKKSAPLSLADKARFDLVRRLGVNLADVEVVDSAVRPTDEEAQRCLAGSLALRESGAQPEQVQWIVLTARGQTHSYAGVEGEVIYCGQ